MEFNQAVELYKKSGANITDLMDDNEILSAIEDFEDNPPPAEPSVEERIAAALEYQNAMML